MVKLIKEMLPGQDQTAAATELLILATRNALAIMLRITFLLPHPITFIVKRTADRWAAEVEQP